MPSFNRDSTFQQNDLYYWEGVFASKHFSFACSFLDYIYLALINIKCIPIEITQLYFIRGLWAHFFDLKLLLGVSVLLKLNCKQVAQIDVIGT